LELELELELELLRFHGLWEVLNRVGIFPPIERWWIRGSSSL
jgi:hypothetical protein